VVERLVYTFFWAVYAISARFARNQSALAIFIGKIA
jgi:hypothetical protein